MPIVVTTGTLTCSRLEVSDVLSFDPEIDEAALLYDRKFV